MKLKAAPLPLLLAVLPLIAAAPVPAPSAGASSTAASSNGVRGDYVEVRTASVFAGACHYNGERVTEGRSAVMAWHIDGGAFGGVDLTGVNVVAALTCDDNLAEPAAARRSEIRVDADTAARATAAVAWLKSRPGQPLGQITQVQRSVVTFRRASDAVTVTAAGFAALAVRPMPDAACCSQPHLVWYTPLLPTESRRVGYTESISYTGPAGAWQRSDENSAFYGRFAPSR